MSTFELRKRHGLGPGVDPHFDAHIGWMLDGSQPHIGAAFTGYIELTGPCPWDDFERLLRTLHCNVLRLSDEEWLVSQYRDAIQWPASIWTEITRINFLTTDPQSGIALPMHEFNPQPSALAEHALANADAALARLRSISNGRLCAARWIGLTVEFSFGAMAERLHAVLHPSTPLQVRTQAVHGCCSTAGQPLCQLVGMSGHVHPQVQRAARELCTDVSSPSPDGYGLPADAGCNTIVGFVDFGCDVADPAFCVLGDDRVPMTRLLALWDQNEKPEQGSRASNDPRVCIGGHDLSMGYGHIFRRGEIDKALRTAGAVPNGEPSETYKTAVYDALGYHPCDHHYTATRPRPGGDPTKPHGVDVMRIAVGGPYEAMGNWHGVAPNAEIVFVQVRRRPQADGRMALDMNDVVDAVAFILATADEAKRACVVNISLNTMSGPHDGDWYFERRLSALLRSGMGMPNAEARGRAVVIAAGNVPEYNSELGSWPHIAETVHRDFEFCWRINENDQTRNTLEIWYDVGADDPAWLALELRPPGVAADARPLGPILPDEAAQIVTDALDPTTICAVVVGSRSMPHARDNGVFAVQEHLSPSAGSSSLVPGRHALVLQIDPSARTAGEWTVLLALVNSKGESLTSDRGVRFDAWLARDDGGESAITRHRSAGLHEMKEEDRQCTIGTLSCGDDAIVVGGYEVGDESTSPYGGQGPGRTPHAPHKPDICAPGHAMHIRDSINGPSRPLSGTSFAAPFVSGTIAGLYQIDRDATLSEVRSALRDTARGKTKEWRIGYGWGQLSPARAVQHIRKPPTS